MANNRKKNDQDLKQDFSTKNTIGYLNYFKPNSKINIYQFGNDVSGKKGPGKTIKIYNGNIFSSLIRGRIPAKIMVKTLFKRLSKQNYKNSEIYLLGIQKNDNELKAYMRFERYNKSNEMYLSAKGLYSLINIDQKWYITEMSTFDDNQKSDVLVNFQNMWYPKK